MRQRSDVGHPAPAARTTAARGSAPPVADPPPKPSQLMKATLTERRFSDPAWVFERKLDGIRCLAVRDGDRVDLRSRNDLDLAPRFPGLVEALRSEPCPRFAVDGEIVAFEGSRTSFSALQRAGRERVEVFLYVFDLLWVDGRDVRGLPLRERKALLRRTLEFHGPVRYTPHRNAEGEALYEEACRRGWEGLIAKRADAPYREGRSADWLKFKCSAEQEFVIGGYTPPKGSRVAFGALLLGYYEGDRLRYAGKVGTGFDEATLRSLGARLEALRTDHSPFADPVRERGAMWVEPVLVAQVAFSEWTRDGRLRHPRFLGLREDKPAHEVVRERSAA
jgi:bifunctional non-homologous end joining protein LigD